MPHGIPETPDWARWMVPYRWYRVSGSAPDLGLNRTPSGTRYLIDNDPRLDHGLNSHRSVKDGLRRVIGRAPRSPWHGTMGISAVTECWNGAVLATGVGRSGAMVCFGGGHNDYFGSDVHQFDLATRCWSRILDGYVEGDTDEYGAGAIYESSVYPDGSPLPPHTYDYLQYDGLRNQMLLFKGQKELGPHVQAVAIPHVLDLTNRVWRHGPEHPQARLNSGGWTTWDPRRRRLWGHSGDDGGGNGLTWYEPDPREVGDDCGRWGPLFPNKLPGIANHNAMQIDPDGECILVAAHARNEMLILDPDDPAAPLSAIREGGSRPTLAPYSALEYSERLSGYVYFGANNGGSAYVLSPRTTDRRTSDFWEWRELRSTIRVLDPIRDAAYESSHCSHPEHVFGRFRVIDYLDGITLAVLVRHVDSPVYAMRLI